MVDLAALSNTTLSNNSNSRSNLRKILSSTHNQRDMEEVHYNQTSRAILCKTNLQVISNSRCHNSRQVSQVSRIPRSSTMLKLRNNKASRLELHRCPRSRSNSRTRPSNLLLPQSRNHNLRDSHRWRIASNRHPLRPQREGAGHQKRKLERGFRI